MRRVATAADVEVVANSRSAHHAGQELQRAEDVLPHRPPFLFVDEVLAQAHATRTEVEAIRIVDPAGALATFYRILEFNPSPDRPPEFFWFYKAGFNAARLLEEQQKWEAAAAIYEKLVAANGPRSEEANARLGQLRLEHFLWQ